uniref:Uncharacterized protein LOC114347780 n=1 Tax=Diabrotica virgifera virgifera TaxID=50390 RepID=A0A6P7H6S0_DIAVI
QLALDKPDLPVASSILLNDTYVDDVTGRDSLQDSVVAIKELISLLNRGGFELHKWASNAPQLFSLADIPLDSILQQSFSFDLDQLSLKVLGLGWNPTTDNFFYKILPLQASCTKRNLLSQIARIFDPYGILNPVTLIVKTIIQRLWLLNLDWDATPPLEITSKWEQFKIQLPLLSKFSIPRYIPLNGIVFCKLHGFCDASLRGSSAVTYLRVCYDTGVIKTYFLLARTKVSPTRVQTIPRLELNAAVILSKLMSYLLQTLTISFSRIYAWSDSTVVLHWINSQPYKWKTFVSNRISYIQDRVASKHWRYIPSSLNSADHGSRGLFPEDFLNTPVWWVGHEFLCTTEDNWSFSLPDSIEHDVELKPKSCLLSFPTDEFVDNLCNRFSSFSKLKLIFSCVLRFIGNLKSANQRTVGMLTIQEQ